MQGASRPAGSKARRTSRKPRGMIISFSWLQRKDIMLGKPCTQAGFGMPCASQLWPHGDASGQCVVSVLTSFKVCPSTITSKQSSRLVDDSVSHTFQWLVWHSLCHHYLFYDQHQPKTGVNPPIWLVTMQLNVAMPAGLWPDLALAPHMQECLCFQQLRNRSCQVTAWLLLLTGVQRHYDHQGELTEIRNRTAVRGGWVGGQA